MLFTQPTFLFFFAVVFAFHWVIQRNRSRKVILLVASYIFYAAWDWRFLSLIVASTLIDYCVGLVLKKPKPLGGRRIWLVASLFANLGILGFFKYYNFFVTSGVGLLTALGIPTRDLTLNIILPVGISFFTFQSMSYTIDIYRGKLKPISSLLDFALFVGFFPQLVAGPIVRAADFLPQLKIPRRLNHVKFKGAVTLFLIGFFKKSCIADNLAVSVDKVFSAPESFSAIGICIAVVCYGVQIYCDFSGYTDMAIAAARLLGYELCLNFSFPYLARNIRDFWRRWHISLSTWLRDYLYISFGGSRGSKLFTLRNVMITMLLGGLWHGASWNFVFWGALHGIALVVHRLYSEYVPEKNILRRLVALVALPLTFYWVSLAWIFFRATSFGNAFTMLKAFVLFNSPGPETLPVSLLYLLISLGLLHWMSYRKSIETRIEHLPDWVCAIGYGIAVFPMLLFVPVENKPFIYFQF